MHSSGRSSGAAGASAPAQQPVFVTTQWSVILSAAQAESADAQAALERLCRTYWYPLYAYVRRGGHSAPDAQDLTQAFFARLLERHWLRDADRERGRFRTFLLTALSRFLCDEWDKAHAQKRGGAIPHLPIQLDTAETRYGQEPADPVTPESCYERRWALTLLETVLGQLQHEYERAGKGPLFAALNSTLVGARDSQPYTQLAQALGMTESAVKVAVHRLRKRYRELLRAAIADTVAGPDEVQDELQHLFAVLGRG